MNTKTKVGFIIVYIILAVLIVTLGFGEEIWLDESFSIHMMDHSLDEIIHFTSIDVHPPLYYFILKLFVFVAGKHMIVYRIASIIPFLVMILIVGLFTTKEINPKAGILSMVIMCAAPSILIYSTEIRMYSWCELFVVCSVIISYKLARKDNTILWVLFCIVNALAAYTHYFAGMAVMIVAICLIINILITKVDVKKRALKWLIANVGTVIIYIPWLAVFFSQLESVREDYWIEAFTFEDLGEYAEFVFGDFSGFVAIIYALIVCAAIVLLIVRRKKIKTFKFAILNLIVFFGYILGGVMLSIIITPVFIERYIAVVLPCLWLFVIFTFLGEENNKIYVATAIIGVLLLIYNYYGEFKWKYIDKNSTIYDSMKNEVKDDDIIFHDNAHSLSILSEYEPYNVAIITEKYLAEEKFKEWHELSPNIDVQKEINIPEDKTVWVILKEDDTSILDYLASKGYKIEERCEGTLPAYKDLLPYVLFKCYR